MPTRDINLTDHLDSFVEGVVSSGRYGNASEVVCEALRLLERREHEDRAKLEWLRGAVKEASDSLERGEGIEFESMDDLCAHIDQMREDVSAELDVERQRG